MRFPSALALPLLLLPSTSLAIVPKPQRWQTGNNTLTLSSNFELSFSTDQPVPASLKAAAGRTVVSIQRTSHRRLTPGLGEEDRAALSSASQLEGIDIQIHTNSSEVLSLEDEVALPLEEREESYELFIPAEGGRGKLVAKSSLGVVWGLRSFEQLWYYLPGKDGEEWGTRYLLDAPVEIDDDSTFPYRGVMLDTSRNYYEVESLEKLIDSLSFVKLNFFHWHITDQHSWPFVVPSLPELSEKGAYAPWMIYSPEDVAHLQSYAAERGVTLLVEIDLPGHTASVAESHPELVVCADARPWANFAAEPPAGQLKLDDPAVEDFIAKLLDDVLPRLKSTYFGTGGDELNAACYNLTAAELSPPVQRFQSHLQPLLAAHDKRPLVWHELATEYGYTLPDGALVQVWGTPDIVGEVLEKQPKGVSVVHSSSDFFYLDCGAGGWLGNASQLNSWCDPYKSWQRIYSFDPYANVSSTDRARIAGGEAALWSEQADAQNFEALIWPRAAALAELFWTHPFVEERTAEADGTLYRMHDVRYRLVQRGITAAPLQPLWCAVRPGKCNLAD